MSVPRPSPALAARKYGVETADLLRRTFRKLDDPAKIEGVAELVFECDTGEELIARVRGYVRDPA